MRQEVASALLAVYLCAHSVGFGRRKTEAPSWVAHMLPVSMHHMAGIITVLIS